jgi:CRP/FNR family cyclic AMP-dependent transcriptional regulator
MMSSAHVKLLQSLLPGPLGQALSPHCRVVTRQSGYVLVGYGDRGSDVFVILEGTVRAELHSPNGREVFFGELGPGDLVGELAALDDQPRTANVVATANCVLACFPSSVFRASIYSNPESAEWVAKQLVARIRSLNERLFELNALAVRSRVHCELLRLSLSAGVKGNRASITPAPTHANLAARIGSHREAITRELQYLLKRGVIRTENRTLVVEDVAQLVEIIRAAAGDSELTQRAADTRA